MFRVASASNCRGRVIGRVDISNTILLTSYLVQGTLRKQHFYFDYLVVVHCTTKSPVCLSIDRMVGYVERRIKLNRRKKKKSKEGE